MHVCLLLSAVQCERLPWLQAYDICGESKPADGAQEGTRVRVHNSSQLAVPVCLVRQSPNLASQQHQQVGICNLNLEVLFPSPSAGELSQQQCRARPSL